MLNIKSLREQIYEYLKDEMQKGKLSPGSSINMNEVSHELGISKTPLRDALIQLEAEGFVIIQPRRGVFVRKLTLREIRESYEIIGALEAAVVLSSFGKFNTTHISRMVDLNEKQRQAIEHQEFEAYYMLNLDFHKVFLDLADNDALISIITRLKQRLYDFPRRKYLKNWESQHLSEHDEFIDHVRNGNREKAASIVRDIHWSFAVHEKYFHQFYKLNDI